MPAFSGWFDWKPGLIWQIGVVPGGLAEVAADGTLQGSMHACNALVDTGATTTCISRGVVTALGLKPTGKNWHANSWRFG